MVPAFIEMQFGDEQRMICEIRLKNCVAFDLSGDWTEWLGLIDVLVKCLIGF